eukprot:TRINITY_DN2150_c0_g1_i2.p1 TRINITY_DN2150_c0_g1~~TRINITY_DN2150_c0_g1_i2.p1  ORF type:complete len:390 (+),score=76.01 TRINITY_DN2150_c0_g1_i2:55-1224(+)
MSWPPPRPGYYVPNYPPHNYPMQPPYRVANIPYSIPQPNFPMNTMYPQPYGPNFPPPPFVPPQPPYLPGVQYSQYPRNFESHQLYGDNIVPYQYNEYEGPPPPESDFNEKPPEPPEEVDAAWLFKKDSQRPSKIVIIMRGLPGSGKTYMTNLFKNLEMKFFSNTSRINSIDDYFMEEVEKEVVDPETNVKVKTKVMEYKYEEDQLEAYSKSALKSFEKTITQGFFSFIIVDNINRKVKDFEQYWFIAKNAGFEVYVFETDCDPKECAARNIHGRTLEEIMKMKETWEPTPPHYKRLRLGNLLSEDIFNLNEISEVEMQAEEEDKQELDLVTVENLLEKKGKWVEDDDNPTQAKSSTAVTGKRVRVHKEATEEQPVKKKLRLNEGLKTVT